MLYGAFDTLDTAKLHRDTHGGWIFLPEGDGSAYPIWFSLTFTPSMIFCHRLTRGMSGKLV